MDSIVVLGTSGQLGSALLQQLGPAARGVSRAEADLSHPQALPAVLDRLAPTVVIVAAAYTNVEKAETEEDLATVVNGEAPGVVARWCADRNVALVHYSTDYVFSQSTGRPHREGDPVGPLNAYGRSKLAGETAVTAAGGRHLVFRTSWVYDARGKNFFRTMARLARERETLQIVADQHGAPTYAAHLASATRTALDRASRAADWPSGVYHVCNAGVTTWYDFACSIFEGLRARGVSLLVQRAEPITTADYASEVVRPLDSRLDTTLVERTLGVHMPSWQQGLNECLEVFA